MEENALVYETLIRSVFKCGRTRRFGADADIYRGLERVSVPALGQKEVDKYLLGIKLGEVSTYLRVAFYEAKEMHKDNDDFVAAVNTCLDLLSEPTMEKIDHCIELAMTAFRLI